MRFQQVTMLNSPDVFHRNLALYSAFLLFLIVPSTTGSNQTYESPMNQRESDYNDEKWLLKNEDPCLRQGGICVKSNYCPEEFRAKGNRLCPEQEAIGAVCCHKVPEEASCRYQGGECMENCGGATNFGRKNCAEGKSCCLLEF